jgi:hypothetical protein
MWWAIRGRASSARKLKALAAVSNEAPVGSQEPAGVLFLMMTIALVTLAPLPIRLVACFVALIFVTVERRQIAIVSAKFVTMLKFQRQAGPRVEAARRLNCVRQCPGNCQVALRP